MAEILRNIFVCGMFVISSVVILKCLKKMGMTVAYWTFFALTLVVSLYIPFFFGGKLLTKALNALMPDSLIYSVFKTIMDRMMAAPFVVMRIVSLLTSVVSAVALIAVVILTANVTAYVIRRIKRAVSAYEARIRKPSFKDGLFGIILSNQDTSYKRFCRLLN